MSVVVPAPRKYRRQCKTDHCGCSATDYPVIACFDGWCISSSSRVHTSTYFLRITIMNYRLIYLATLARVFLLPPLILSVFFRVTPQLYPNHRTLRLFLYILSAPLAWSIRKTYELSSQASDAKRLGARQIPTVRGKWPGNIDIAKR